jgi:GNAT superfamily N-acetyltransferase
MRIDEVIKLSNIDRSRAKEWIEKVYSKYPQVWQNNHVMTWGEGDEQQFAMFELVPSLSKHDAVEVKWFQAYPLRQGVGSRAMAELQRLAKEDNIALTLYPWDKGQVSQAKLTKFYKGHGFKPTTKGSKNMFWEPEKLDESLSRIVYHYTNIHSALKILSSGQFELSSVLGSIEQSYAPKDHLYFLSTTRTRQGGYHDYIGNQAVLFVLDGNWFNNHYISRPVDYWENRNPSLAHHRKHEAEDRVFSREPTIPIDGIVAVHIYIDPKSDPEVRARARQALIAAKRLGIDTYFYTDPKAWRNFDQRNPGDVSLLTGPEHTSYRSYPEREYLLPWIELISAKNKSQLSKKADDLRYSLNYTYDKENAAQGLNTDLSNARKPSAGADRANAVKIINYMRRNNVSTVKKLVELLADKWKSDSITEYVNAETVKTGFRDQQVVGDLLLTAEGEDRKVYNTDVNVLHIRVLTNTPEREELAWTDFLVKKRHEDGEKYLEAAYVFVSPRHRGKGLAKLMYQYANDTLGNDIQPSAMQTDMGKGMWTGLNKSIRKPVALKPEEPKMKPSLFSRIRSAFKEDQT